MADQATLGFLGGTGPLGRGLAMRFAQAGHRVLIGSRDEERARQAARRVAEVAGATAVEGADNHRACADADIVFVTVPYGAQRPTLEAAADAIGDKLVVNCVNALAFDGDGPHPAPVGSGSSAQECQELLPAATVASAFHHVPAPRLMDAETVPVDVLVCADDPGARARVAALAGEIPGLTGVEAGPLRLSGAVEDMTAVLLWVNRRYKAHTGLRIEGLD